MKFDLKTPCVDCPFLCGSSTNQSLDPERLEGIIYDTVNNDDSTFICHKTMDFPKIDQQHCGGALQYLERMDKPNQMMRIAERVGMYDRYALIFHDKLIKTPKL